jgi:cell pole-organizing protein PopZ
MGDISAEPSMEDILSSIKRIIAEEGETATANRTRRAARTTMAPRIDAASFGHDEILELSDPMRSVEEEPSMGDEYEEPVVRSPVVPASMAPPPKNPATSPAAPVPPADPILSHRAAEASRGSLDALSRMIVKPEVQGSDSLEGMVREMLRPMLRDWLDANLPAMVETMVSREIARITGSR